MGCCRSWQAGGREGGRAGSREHDGRPAPQPNYFSFATLHTVGFPTVPSVRRKEARRTAWGASEHPWEGGRGQDEEAMRKRRRVRARPAESVRERGLYLKQTTAVVYVAPSILPFFFGSCAPVGQPSDKRPSDRAGAQLLAPQPHADKRAVRRKKDGDVEEARESWNSTL